MPPKRCPNQVYVDILQQKLDDLLEANPESNKQHSYKKAIKAFRAEPERFDSPHDAIRLTGVGKVTIQELVKALKKQGASSSRPNSDDSPPKKRKPAKPPKEKPAAKKKAPAKRKHDSSSSDESDAPARKKPANAVTWVPEEGSAAYSILIALHSFCSPTEQKTWRTEAELTMYAAPFCTQGDMTKTVGFGGAAIQTPWKIGSSLLKNKGLIVDNASDPLRYSLTPSGFDISQQCAAKADMDRIMVQSSNFDTPHEHDRPSKNGTKPKPAAAVAIPAVGIQRAVPRHSDDFMANLSAATSEPDETRAPLKVSASSAGKKVATGAFAKTYVAPPAPAPHAEADDLPFLWCFLDDDDQRVKSRDEAAVRMYEDGYSYFRIEYRLAQARHPQMRNVKHLEKITRDSEGIEGKTGIGHLLKSHTLAECPGFTSLEAGVKKLSAREKATASLMAGAGPSKTKDKEAMYKLPEAVKLKRSASDNPDRDARLAAAESRLQKSASLGAVPSSSSKPASRAPSSSASHYSSPAPPARATLAVPKGTGLHRQNSTTKFDESWRGAIIAASSIDFPTFQPHTLEPGSFSIVLLYDNREEMGLSNLGARLSGKGVLCENRVLPVGDFAWIARCNITGTEFMLAILERKRLDDLIKSVKDGRYEEQKVRLKKSGLDHIFYLIEETRKLKEGERDTYLQQIKTTRSQLQVINGFNVHIAWTVEEVIRYFRTITESLISRYQNKRLYAVPDNLVHRSTFLQFKMHLRRTQPSINYLTTFPVFERSNAKLHTIRSEWAKMACSIAGMSEEKACDFIEKWKTPQLFWQAIRRVIEGEEGKEVVEYKTKAAEKRAREAGAQGWVMNQTAREVAARGINFKLSEDIYGLFSEHRY